MIVALLVATSVSTAPPPPAVNTSELLIGASHAIRADRLDQASLMISRAMAAGASGAPVERVLANLDYARGKLTEALARYDVLLKSAPTDQALLEPAAIAALKLGQIDRAASLLDRATAGKRPSWRVWNACGVVADQNADWVKADACYEKAAELAPDQPGVANNRGWSRLMRGDWTGARGFFEQAVALDPKSQRAANNLELARTAIAAELPRREPRETDSSWAARLNDAGVAAAILGNKERAAAAFTQALNVSGTWYERAANNLETLSRQ
jgi:Flp pilus assembly protein TadD